MIAHIFKEKNKVVGDINSLNLHVFHAFVVVYIFFSNKFFQEHYQNVKQFGSRLGVTFCILGNFSCFCCRLITLFHYELFSKNSFKNKIRVSNELDPDQDRHSVSPDWDSNCLQRLSADDKCRG